MERIAGVALLCCLGTGCLPTEPPHPPEPTTHGTSGDGRQPDLQNTPDYSAEAIGPGGGISGPYQKGLVDIHSIQRPAALHVAIESVVRDRFPEAVEAFVYVRDERGQFVTGMAPPHANAEKTKSIWMAVREQMGQRECGDGAFSVKEVHEDIAPPRSVMFVADYSGSMVSDIGKVEADIPSAIDELRFTGPYLDTWGLTKFDHRVRVVFGSGQKGAIDSAHSLTGLRDYGGGTALRDAMLTGIDHLTSVPANQERILVVFTDGQENASFIDSWNILVQRALKERIRIHTIGYGNVDSEQLSVIADRTGGSFYKLDRTMPIAGVFQGIVHKTKVYYRVTYKPCQEPGKRTLVLDLSVPGRAGEPARAIYTYSQDRMYLQSDSRPRVLVLFPFDKANMLQATLDKERLTAAATFLKEHPGLFMTLTGYTDSKGKERYNSSLGRRRASAVKAELVRMGVAKKRVRVKTEGMSQPIHDPDYPEEWKAFENRRVEFELSAK